MVRADEQAVALDVVAGVDDDRQLGAEPAWTPWASLAPPTPPASTTTVTRPTARRPVGVERRADLADPRQGLASYGAGSRTMTVSNPSRR